VFSSHYDKVIVSAFEHQTSQSFVILEPSLTHDSDKESSTVCVIKDGLSADTVDDLRKNYPHVCFHGKDFQGRADVVIDMSDTPPVLEYLTRKMIPIVKKQSTYIKDMVNGVVMSENDLLDFLKSLFENTDVLLNVLCKGVETFSLLTSDDFCRDMWQQHLKNPCPFRTLNTRFSTLVYTDFAQKYFIKNLDQIVGLESRPDGVNCVVLVDNRANMMSVLSVIFSLINLNVSWSCIVYTSEKGLALYNKWLSNIAIIKHAKPLDVKRFHIDVYNRFLMDEQLWASLDYDKCLVIQDDGVVIRKGIEQFMEYDYVGAPWAESVHNDYIKHNVNSDMVGNGGLSLRSVSCMREITQTYQKEKLALFFKNINNVPEDVYFAKHLKKIGALMPPASVASSFSSEEILNPKSIGFHKVWGYHHPEVVKQYFQRVLE
jgi:hypothetical protein